MIKIEKFKLLDKAFEVVFICYDSDWTNILDQARKVLVSDLKIKGFRPGKIPADLADKYVKSENVLSKATQIAYKQFYDLLCKQKGIEFVKKYRIDNTKVEKISFSELQVHQLWERLPSVVLKKWKDFVCSVEPVKIQDSEIQKKIDELKVYLAEFIVKKTPIQKGDFVTINYQGKVDNKAVKDLAGKDFRFPLGQSMFGSGFDHALLALETANKKTFAVTLPDNYHNEQLRDKQVTFDVEIIKVEERKLPNNETDLVNKLKMPHVKTYDDLKKLVAKSLEREQLNNLHSEIIKIVWPQIINQAELHIPEKYLNYEAKAMKQKQLDTLQQQKTTLEKYLKQKNQTEKQFEDEIKDKVKQMLIDYLIVTEIAEKENIKVTKKEIDEYYQFLVKQTQKVLEEVKKIYSENILFNNLMRYKVEQFITENTLNFNNKSSATAQSKTSK